MNRKNKIRVLVLSHMYPNKTNLTYGNFIHNQTKRLITSGCDIRVVSPVPYVPKFLRSKPKWRSYMEIPFYDVIDEVPVYYPRYITPPGQCFHGFSGYSVYTCIKNKVNSIVNEFSPQIIHAHTATPDGYAGLLFKHKYKLPLVCSLRGSDINIYPFYDKLSLSITKSVITKTDQLVSVSHALKKMAESIAKPERPIRVLHNGCEFINFSSSKDNHISIRNNLGIDKNETLIIFVGDLKKHKGVFELLNAFITLGNKHPEAHLILLGNGPENINIKDKIIQSGLSKRIHLMGTRPHNEIYNWLNASDLFVLPTYCEGLPNALLEAMACGLPVIATKVGGIPELIRDGENGILIEAERVDDLYQAIIKMLNNIEVAKKLGNKGREFVEQEFTWEINVNQMTEIYKNVIYDN